MVRCGTVSVRMGYHSLTQVVQNTRSPYFFFEISCQNMEISIIYFWENSKNIIKHFGGVVLYLLNMWGYPSSNKSWFSKTWVPPIGSLPFKTQVHFPLNHDYGRKSNHICFSEILQFLDDLRSSDNLTILKV